MERFVSNFNREVTKLEEQIKLICTYRNAVREKMRSLTELLEITVHQEVELLALHQKLRRRTELVSKSTTMEHGG